MFAVKVNMNEQLCCKKSELSVVNIIPCIIVIVIIVITILSLLLFVVLVVITTGYKRDKISRVIWADSILQYKLNLF